MPHRSSYSLVKDRYASTFESGDNGSVLLKQAQGDRYLVISNAEYEDAVLDERDQKRRRATLVAGGHEDVRDESCVMGAPNDDSENRSECKDDQSPFTSTDLLSPIFVLAFASSMLIIGLLDNSPPPSTTFQAECNASSRRRGPPSNDRLSAEQRS